MHKKYLELFETLAQSSAVVAEEVMTYDMQQKDEQGYKTAEIMRNDFQDLHDRIKEAGETYVPNHADATKLMVGTYIQLNNAQDRLESLKRAIAGYQSDLIPKLQQLIDNEDKTDETIKKLAEELFVIDE